MRFLIKCAIFIVLAATFLYFADILQDKALLRNQIVRMHVVANSDSKKDQQVKLQVKDTVTAYLNERMSEITDIDEAKKFLNENLQKIEHLANIKLQELGEEYKATVKLDFATFGERIYDTFSLPAGIYRALQIELGEAKGKNWWCVVFPTLCVPKTVETFEDEAVEAGMNATLTSTLTREKDYEIRFFILDFIGRIENLIFSD